jgi:hypothetical protein
MGQDGVPKATLAKQDLVDKIQGAVALRLDKAS